MCPLPAFCPFTPPNNTLSSFPFCMLNYTHVCTCIYIYKYIQNRNDFQGSSKTNKKIITTFPTLPKPKLSYNLTVSFMGIHPVNSIPYHRDTCTFKLISAIFTTARKWNQSSCSSTGEGIMKT